MANHPLTNVKPGALGRIRHVLGTTVDTASAGSTEWIEATYDFAVDGGAVGTIPLIGSTDIPSGAIILGGHVEVITPLTSGGSATVAVQVEAANDIVNAAAYSGAPWSTAGIKSIIPAGTGATAVKTTAARDVSVVIGTAALTAGKFTVRLSYLSPSAN